MPFSIPSYITTNTNLNPSDVSFYKGPYKQLLTEKITGINEYLNYTYGPLIVNHEREDDTDTTEGERMSRPTGGYPIETVITQPIIDDLLSQDPPIEKVWISIFDLVQGEFAWWTEIVNRDKKHILDLSTVISGLEEVVTLVSSPIGEEINSSNIDTILTESMTYPNRFFPEDYAGLSPVVQDSWFGVLGSGTGSTPLHSLLQEDIDLLDSPWYDDPLAPPPIPPDPGFIDPLPDWQACITLENARISTLLSIIDIVHDSLDTVLTDTFPETKTALLDLKIDILDLQERNVLDLAASSTWGSINNHPGLLARKNFIISLIARGRIVPDISSLFIGKEKLYDTRWYWLERLIHRMFGSFVSYHSLLTGMDMYTYERDHHQLVLNYIDTM